MADGLVEVENRKGSGGCFFTWFQKPIFLISAIIHHILQNPKLHLLEISFDPSSS